jgi:hypothetical protein
MSLRQQVRQIEHRNDGSISSASSEVYDLLATMAEEIDNLRSELELTQKRCDRNRNTSDDWMD